MPPAPSATTGCSGNRKAMSRQTPSRTARPSNACAGSAAVFSTGDVEPVRYVCRAGISEPGDCGLQAGRLQPAAIVILLQRPHAPTPHVSLPCPSPKRCRACSAALEQHRNVVLEAPAGRRQIDRRPARAARCGPGLGSGQILMLEPRRLAARAVAARMATLLGEPVGKTVGYRTRLDTKVSAATRIEVVTEGSPDAAAAARPVARRRGARHLR